MFPPVKRYFVEMRFKPMPKYHQGVLAVPKPALKDSPVGKLLIQPMVRVGNEISKLDDVIGQNFALIAWEHRPEMQGLSEAEIQHWQQLGTKFIQVVPIPVQLKSQIQTHPDVLCVGDETHALKDWFGRYPASVAIIRPDRFVASIAIPQSINTICQQVRKALSAWHSRTATRLLN
ncbi:hypothetical protein P4S64_13795 [Vibrio sp. M60_M31a]